MADLERVREAWRGSAEAHEQLEQYVRLRSQESRVALLRLLESLPLLSRYESELRRSIERTAQLLEERRRHRAGLRS
jgi:hypothetical protein